MQPKKLYKLREGRQIDGVCAGIAEYLNIDVSIVRLLWVIFSIIPWGLGIIVYIAAVIILPVKE